MLLPNLKTKHNNHKTVEKNILWKVRNKFDVSSANDSTDKMASWSFCVFCTRQKFFHKKLPD